MTRPNTILRGISFCSLLAAALSARGQSDDESWLRHFRIGGSFMLKL
jgi:hypothetical protein